MLQICIKFVKWISINAQLIKFNNVLQIISKFKKIIKLIIFYRTFKFIVTKKITYKQLAVPLAKQIVKFAKQVPKFAHYVNKIFNIVQNRINVVKKMVNFYKMNLDFVLCMIQLPTHVLVKQLQDILMKITHKHIYLSIV